MGKVYRKGGSLVVNIPKAYALSLHISQGSIVEWKDSKEGFVLIPKRIHNPRGAIQ